MSADLVLHAGGLILTDQGTIVENQRVVVRDGKIVSIEPATSRVSSPEVIDLSDMTVLPGLIDCHTHLTLQHEMKDIVGELRRSQSVALEDGIASDPPSMLPRIDYRSHADTAAEMAAVLGL